MRRLLNTMIAVGGLIILTSTEAAVKNVAWLQGTSLNNGSSVLKSTEPMGIKWAAYSSIDPSIYDHSLANPTKLVVRKDGDYLVGATLPMKGTGVRSV